MVVLNYSERYTVPKVIIVPRYNMKCSGENVTLRGIFHVVSCCPLHFMLYRGNFDYFWDSVGAAKALTLFCSDKARMGKAFRLLDSNDIYNHI